MQKNNSYNPEKIEAKWQKYWEDNKMYQAEDFSDKPKKFILIEFPYPSGAGLHVGHVRSYTALDVKSRKLRMDGYNVLYPIGWDAFGLPTENYAIKNKIHPIEATKQNIATFKRQLKSLGISYDWSREINTTDPKYYKWTQWIFLKFLEKGLAYKDKMPINWCLSCKVGLANEEVVNGKCERCGGDVEKREKEQWMLAITKYADRLIDDLNTVNFLEKIATQQKNWIGRSEGAMIKFKLSGDDYLEVFTTRIDTIYGCTYCVIAPEHELVEKYKGQMENYDEVKLYVVDATKKSDMERTELAKDKTGVEIKGVKAINPFTNEEVPIFVADYVLGNYGTGAVMAVPAHDERDFEFAQKFDLPIKVVIAPKDQKTGEYIALKGENPEEDSQKILEEVLSGKRCYENKGELIDSGDFSELYTDEAREKMTAWLEENNLGEKKINFKLRDWIFSRQRYWGEPIPVIHCGHCGTVPVPEKDLPVVLPDVESYEPTDTGESPLAKIEDWVNVDCPVCGGAAKRETDTMPNWAGSSWYFLRYIDPKNNKALADPEKLKYWMPVDLYNGGMEHTTLHLLYSRFWHKFLHDIDVLPKEISSEPYARRVSHGMVFAEDGKKMSKSLGNVVNPDQVVNEFGADSLRMYEMFMGPFAEAIPWSTNGVVGVKRFLDRVWRLYGDFMVNIEEQKDWTNADVESEFQKTIKNVTDDIDNFKFNTAISTLMKFINYVDDYKKNSEGFLNIEIANRFLKLLSPFAPHITEELWKNLGHSESIFTEKWPTYDESKIKEDEIEIIVQVNGKLRDKIMIGAEATQDDVKEIALKREKVKKYIENKEIRKVIYVPGRLISFVV